MVTSSRGDGVPANRPYDCHGSLRLALERNSPHARDSNLVLRLEWVIRDPGLDKGCSPQIA